MLEIDKQNALRIIPSVNEIILSAKVLDLIEHFGRTQVMGKLKLVLEEFRSQTELSLKKSEGIAFKTREEVSAYIMRRLAEALEESADCGLKSVINATGIVLHTNLGRAPLPQKAADIMKDAAVNYCNLEFNLETGSRGSRHSHIEAMITGITGAESAVIVNNNAAAVFLCLNTLANNREVIISRGQQVEIGGSFRIPDIISGSSAKMSEVGTTNKTRISDYSNAVNENTSVLLKVHTSNYKITGFTQEVTLKELAALGKARDLTVMEDLGSGCLYDLTQIGLPYEPTVQDSIRDGADIVTFSGDKLLGGPQAGIIAGRKDLIDRIKQNPLMRMVRCDKVTIAAMTAVLSFYKDLDNAAQNIPVLKMMSAKEDELYSKAVELEKQINKKLEGKIRTEIIDDLDEVGGGSLPGVILKGKAVSLTPMVISVNEIQSRLRKAKTPIVCRISRDRILFNVRTIEKEDYNILVEELLKILE